jgi:hypothetical protein
MNPFKIDPDGVPVFSSRDVDDYGLPEHYGYEIYRVVESRDLNIGYDFKFERDRQWRDIHRYNREARFRVTLLNLLGERGNIPDNILALVKQYLKPDSSSLWNDTRKILKHYKLRKYYDQIPLILSKLEYKRLFPQISATRIFEITQDFNALVSRYEQIKHLYNRKYFPNIRFITFKLLELHKVYPTYFVPQIRTFRKNKILTQLWDDLIANKKFPN